MCRWGFQSVAACRESLEAGTREEKKGRKIIFNKIIVGVYLACYVGSKVVVPALGGKLGVVVRFV